MKNTLTVMKFTMKDMLSKKAFIISTIIILLLIVLGCNVPRIVKAIAGEHEDARGPLPPGELHQRHPEVELRREDLRRVLPVRRLRHRRGCVCFRARWLHAV